MIASFLMGLVMSCIGSIPPTGPIALIVLKRGLNRQNHSALSLATGAAVAEAGYALLAYLGINFALSRYPIQTFILRIIAGIILIGFAIICYIDGCKTQLKPADREYRGANFLLGLSIAGLNPTFLVTWTGAVTAARGAGLISDIHAAPAFALGVIAGPILWFWILLKLLTQHVETVHPDSLKKIEKILPLALLILAGVMLTQAFVLLMRNG
jgi:threonine/homoserine/homoserine lactone efflux protein